MLSGVVLGLGILRVRPEVELISGVRVELGERVGVRSVAGAVSESELYSGTGSLPARRKEGAPVRARLRMRGPRVERSRGEGTACDGWAAGSHAMAHGDVGSGLELEVSVVVEERNFAERRRGPFCED
jgi:hypothetical protein